MSEPSVAGAAGDLASTIRALRLPATPESAVTARRHVVDALRAWGVADLAEDAALCATELATNAILHSRGTFTISIRRSLSGARVDVQDDRPERLPVVVPDSFEPLDTGITGRGLILVAAIARRWGYFTTDVAKTIWFEVSSDEPEEPTAPIVEIVERERAAPAFTLRLIDMPVRAAIASGIQVDELVRELQLDRARLDAADRDQLHALLDRSAGPRLVGRQQAFNAAAEGKQRYAMALRTTLAEAGALAELSALLARLATQSEIEAAAVGAEVLALREWINSELVAQSAGAAPTPYPAAHSDR
ncbi:MAG TPA: ATP-binding protein [Mycobacteriales bacterium]|nr:ATP-binding protein [Mycobacteriales bacterium]